MKVNWLPREELYLETKKRVIPSRILMDIGAGIYPQQFFVPAIHIIVEPYLPYIQKLMETTSAKNHYIFLNSEWSEAIRIMPDKSVDTIMAVDVIEHLNKEEGYLFLSEAERVARNQIVIFTPLGLYQQSYQPGDADRWGMQGGEWQSHKSGWLPEDFVGNNWEFFVSKDYHLVNQHEEPLHEPFGAFWAINTIENGGEIPIEERLMVSELIDIKTKYIYNKFGEELLSIFRYRDILKYLIRTTREIILIKIKNILGHLS